MIIVLIILAVGLYAWIRTTQGQIEEANAQIRAELGDRYNEDAAGQPRNDGLLLVILALVVAVVLAAAIGSAIPVQHEMEANHVQQLND